MPNPRNMIKENLDPLKDALEKHPSIGKSFAVPFVDDCEHLGTSLHIEWIYDDSMVGLNVHLSKGMFSEHTDVSFFVDYVIRQIEQLAKYTNDH